MTERFRVGQRQSYDGALCTVRYVGAVGTTKGEWLGVEWDDGQRGKHSGEHEGKRYFDCMIPDAGSFIRPTRKADTPLSFLEALRKKYATQDDPSKNREIALTANKVMEEVGFDKIVQKLSQLQELKIVLLDGLCIDRVDEAAVISETCPNIEELDLSRNLFEKLEDITNICSALPKLKSLRISGNRFNSLEAATASAFTSITSLEISNLLFGWSELTTLLAPFPAIHTLIAPHNNFATIPTPCPFPSSLTTLDLSHNAFSSLSSVVSLSGLPKLRTLLLPHNTIATLSTPAETLFDTLARLDLAYNALPSFQELDHLHSAFPALSSLRVGHNPFYTDVSLDEGHMLTIGRLPMNVTILNHSTITPKERENAEIWYLSRISRELSSSPAEGRDGILNQHARWGELCSLHGEPAVAAQGSSDENTLAGRLMVMEFVKEGKSVRRKIPRSTPVSTLRALVGRWFGIGSLGLTLVCEIGEGEETVVLGDAGETREVGMYVEGGMMVRVLVESS